MSGAKIAQPEAARPIRSSMDAPHEYDPEREAERAYMESLTCPRTPSGRKRSKRLRQEAERHLQHTGFTSLEALALHREALRRRDPHRDTPPARRRS